MNRTIHAKYKASYSLIDDLSTYQALPARSMEEHDPFLLLNHHGPQTYGPDNGGLPFGPHPHRGFETLTFILKGELMHWDSDGHKSVIKEGGIQWMTAGSGLIHSENLSEEFLKTGGEEEIIQLWMNLPARLKMQTPDYQGLSKEELTHFELDEGKVQVHLVSGSWGNQQGPARSLTGLTMSCVEMQASGGFSLSIPQSHNILFYVIEGKVTVNGQQAATHESIHFNFEGEVLEVKAEQDARILLGHGEPLKEPITAHGPFVMNHKHEIMQAMQDYQSGKMGSWQG